MASKIKLLEIRGVCRSFPRGSGEELRILEVDLMIKVPAAQYWWPYCTVSRGRQMSRQSKIRLTAYDGGGDCRRRLQQRASQYDRRNTEINHQAGNVYKSCHKRG